ncbi:PAS domain S-box protein [Flavobacterium sp. MC2016-06]|jgi:PAS domain S-box-containing protein|uniref:PAS domain S-box protein n=1 Tax=Flavobacterium sp. MC2016-06 TaxID=2676308 RepID=UPI0012BA99FF|nr:PAS domain S-box protein [Flavobacterium sp. MC2016-06]MBU3861688.1 PAS domain-containing protein [Flavobacterium sp. MC2016-06]
MNRKKKEHYFLADGGEMGELIRSKDWSKTPLGDPEKWPKSLCTMVSVMLNNPFGMYIAWGKEFTQLYNDSFRPILGLTKHPKALGISTTETFSEIWNIISSMFDDVMKGQSVSLPDFMVPLHRNGYEECYFDFSYSPIKIEKGEVGGVLVTVIETTEKKRVSDALKESNARFINNIMQAPVAICILRGENHIVEIANDKMMQLWGTEAKNTLNKSIFDVLPKTKDRDLEKLIRNVYTTGNKFTTNENLIQLQHNGKNENTYVNFAYEALTETDGSISGVVVTATEVTDQVLSRSKVEESEQKVRELVENAPFPIALYVGKEMIVELANDSIIKIWGKGNDVIGKSFKDVVPELNNQLVFEQINEVLTTGKSFHTKNTPLDLTVDGKLHTYYFNYSLTPIYDVKGNIYGVMNTGVDLTDLNLAKKKIEESNKRFRNTVKQAPVGITILRGPELVVEMANEAYLKLVDRSENTFVGMPLFDSLPEVKESVSELLGNVLKTGIPFHGYELPIPLYRYGKQEICYFDFLYHPLKEEDGEISGIIVTVTEVSEKVEARKKIEQNEERLNIVVQASELGTWELNVKTREPKYSKRYLQIIGGYTNDVELTHEELLQHLHPDDMHIRNKAFKEAISTGILSFEARLIWKDNSIHWMEGKGKVFYDDDQNPEKLIGTVRDITIEKNHQEELEQQVTARTKELQLINESLKKSEERYHLMVEEVQEYAILYLNHDGIIENWNIGAEKIKGYKAEEIIGKYFAVFYTEEDQKNKLPQTLLQLARENGKTLHEGWRVKKNGKLFWASVVITAVHNKKNQVIGFSKVTHDLTEKKQADDKLKLNALELKQKNIELEQMNKELQSFAYISSHDLQEPLRKIQTFATQIMEKEAMNLSDNGKDKFQRMQNAAQRMQTLINDLLSYSRTNIQERVFEKIDLSKIINEVKEDLKEELEQKEAVVEIGETSQVNIIPFQFRQLLYNLVSNSLKFSKPDIPTIVKIKSEIKKGKDLENDSLIKEINYCHINVSDNGIGFEPQYSKKIFEVFQRLHGRDQYNGTGIGLAIVKKIVENHNGIITASGEQNKGASFDIYIPVIQNKKS